MHFDQHQYYNINLVLIHLMGKVQVVPLLHQFINSKSYVRRNHHKVEY